MNHDTHYNCKLQYDTVRFCTSSDNISLIKGKENLFKHTFDIETGEVTSMEFNSQANLLVYPCQYAVKEDDNRVLL